MCYSKFEVISTVSIGLVYMALCMWLSMYRSMIMKPKILSMD